MQEEEECYAPAFLWRARPTIEYFNEAITSRHGHGSTELSLEIRIAELTNAPVLANFRTGGADIYIYTMLSFLVSRTKRAEEKNEREAREAKKVVNLIRRRDNDDDDDR